MRTLLIAIAAVAFLAAPAIAADAERDVKLTIDAYARIQGGDPLTITLTEGASSGQGQLWFDLVSNVAATVGVLVVEEGGAVGDWSIIGPTVYDLAYAGLWHCGVTVRVENVGPGEAPISSVKQATVEITIVMP